MKTTKKDFEIFKEECEKWIEKFGLKDWEVKYSQLGQPHLKKYAIYF